MAIRKIVTFPNKILREKVEPFDFNHRDGYTCGSFVWPEECRWCQLQLTIQDMFDTLWNSDNGIALAANQVGITDHRIFVINTRYGNGPLPPVVVNPSFTPMGDEVTDEEEGCLSFPGYRKVVRRPSKVTATFQDIKGHVSTAVLDGIWARVFQHETDHLDGTLFLDDLPKHEREKVATQIVMRRKK